MAVVPTAASIAAISAVFLCFIVFFLQGNLSPPPFMIGSEHSMEDMAENRIFLKKIFLQGVRFLS